MKDLIGKQFGRLTVVKASRPLLRKDGRHNYTWKCKCVCGGSKITITSYLTSGHVKSCGCIVKEGIRKTHGAKSALNRKKYNKLYNTWVQMRGRCRNKNRRDYRWYGAKGVGICKEWEDYTVFARDMGEPPTPKHTLERINYKKGYSNSNCRWATQQEQVRNCSSNIWITYQGKRLLLAEWARELGMNKLTLWNRVRKYKWTIKKAFTKPLQWCD